MVYPSFRASALSTTFESIDRSDVVSGMISWLLGAGDIDRLETSMSSFMRAIAEKILGTVGHVLIYFNYGFFRTGILLAYLPCRKGPGLSHIRGSQVSALLKPGD